MSGKHELFYKNPNIPKLNPVGKGYDTSPKKIIKDYMN